MIQFGSCRPLTTAPSSRPLGRSIRWTEGRTQEAYVASLTPDIRVYPRSPGSDRAGSEFSVREREELREPVRLEADDAVIARSVRSGERLFADRPAAAVFVPERVILVTEELAGPSVVGADTSVGTVCDQDDGLTLDGVIDDASGADSGERVDDAGSADRQGVGDGLRFQQLA